MSESDTVVVRRELPRVAAIRALDGTRVAVTWTSGAEQPVDLAPMIATYKLYAPLRENPLLFETVHVGERGSSIAWGEGDTIDMSAVALKRLAELTDVAGQELRRAASS